MRRPSEPVSCPVTVPRAAIDDGSQPDIAGPPTVTTNPALSLVSGVSAAHRVAGPTVSEASASHFKTAALGH